MLGGILPGAFRNVKRVRGPWGRASTSTDLALLALFALLAFMAANIAFLRAEID